MRKIIPSAPSEGALQDAASTYLTAVKAAEETEKAKRSAAAALLNAMAAAGFSPEGEQSVRTLSGTVTVHAGRETITIVCDALKAEIEAIRQRSVRTGRGVLKVGAPYVTLKR